MKAADKHPLLHTLAERFQGHPERHAGIAWADVAARLDARPAALRALQATGQLLFCDCAAETPSGRRSLCFDDAALHARKENKPAGSAMGMAATLGIELLDEAQYRALQELGEFDLKTSSWLATPGEVRALGGALFGDRRYGGVFTYHNGVQSYYAARGFRGLLRV